MHQLHYMTTYLMKVISERHRTHQMITVLKWKKACINLVIAYFNIELKWIKLTSHTDTKLIWIWVINIGWGMITVLLWKKSCIDLFIESLDIVLSDFCPISAHRLISLWHFRCLSMGKIDVITYKYVINSLNIQTTLNIVTI